MSISLCTLQSYSTIQYTVTGRGYTFTRHNNKLTMNINTEVFFDDKATTAESGSRKKPTSSPMPVTHKQRLASCMAISETALYLYLYLFHFVEFRFKSNLKIG